MLEHEHFAFLECERHVLTGSGLHCDAVELVGGDWKLPVQEGGGWMALVDEVGCVAGDGVQGVGDVRVDGEACHRVAIEAGAAGALLGSQVKGAQG